MRPDGLVPFRSNAFEASDRSLIGLRSGSKSRTSPSWVTYLHELAIGLLNLHRILTDIPQLVPEPVKPSGVRVHRDQSLEGFILAMKQD